MSYILNRYIVNEKNVSHGFRQKKAFHVRMYNWRKQKMHVWNEAWFFWPNMHTSYFGYGYTLEFTWVCCGSVFSGQRQGDQIGRIFAYTTLFIWFFSKMHSTYWLIWVPKNGPKPEDPGLAQSQVAARLITEQFWRQIWSNFQKTVPFESTQT
jgi:hypothetical protein